MDSFFDVFKDIRIDGVDESVVAAINIDRIVTNKAKTAIRIYSHGPIEIDDIKKNTIESQLLKDAFGGEPQRVELAYDFIKNKCKSAKELFENDRSKAIDALNKKGILMVKMLENSSIDFPEEDKMEVDLPDTLFYHEKEKEFTKILGDLFLEEGIKASISIIYHEESDSYRDVVKEKMKNAAAKIEYMANAAAENENNTHPEISSQPTTDDNGAAYEKPEIQNIDEKKSKKPKNKIDPDILYGRAFNGEKINVSDITLDTQEALLYGEIFAVEERQLRNGKFLFMLAFTDDTDSIYIKLFVEEDDAEELRSNIKAGTFVSVKGYITLDNFSKELTMVKVRGIKRISNFRKQRVDYSNEKRVELHCHTKMSEMDGLAEVKDIIALAKHFGHEAIAITDHGVVQAFPEADHSAGDDIKIIYGMEAYLIDDTRDIAINDKGQSLLDSYVVFDIETTGLDASKDKIIEIGAVKVIDGKIADSFNRFVNPNEPLSHRIKELTNITDDMLISAATIDIVLPEFYEYAKESVLVAHNAMFDVSFILRDAKKLGIDWQPTFTDTVPMAHILLPELKRFKLDTVAKKLGVKLLSHHRAVDDAMCTANIFVDFIDQFIGRDIKSLSDLNELEYDEGRLKKLHYKHCILLAKNDIGRINLYRLVSMSHLKYYHKKPLVPKSELIKHREGLIIGSACERGEVFQAVLQGRNEIDIKRIVDFYDYLEIQPVGNNEFYLRDEKSGLTTYDDLREINKKIVNLGEKYNKPVVATCDVHFLNPEDEIYRSIIMSSKKFKDADMQPPLYLHTTDEMLEEFSYLGDKKAKEVVIDNTVMIANMCERIHPTRPDKCPPVIENSDIELREICEKRAHEIYGENLPDVVTKRLERELNSIISNGYAVMYIIAQKLVFKSNEDGYLVGSRGSVGSSFVATMAGISEVNPLSPHYICPNCHYTDFDSEEVKKYSGMSGFDMPDKQCPHCGTNLNKDGFDIPFETFLGFKGNKEPDIDLNFASDYLNKAHKYTEVIFGEGHTFRAGTVGTVAEKTAYGYVKDFYESKNEHVRKAQIEHVLKGCTGVRRATGQHPGGIIVLPWGEEIDSFTPIQHPANDMETDIITTHFDYHSIDENLLKLDILGKDDPSQIRMLEDLTGVSVDTIRFDDQKVLSLFQNTKALGLEPEDLMGCDFGTMGIPEFGTDFAMGILRDTKPDKLSDLVRIAGLSHGTDVWQSNAEVLIKNGDATISTAICTRDDIMLYLISMGIESERSFKIMEAVRKGIVAKKKAADWDEWKADMIEHGVPDWYIWSCEMIKYMFPKAHAAAYVMMAFRIGFYKVYYPLAYYAAYFTIRAQFNYEKMCQGKETLLYYIEETENEAKEEKLSTKKKDELRDMKIVYEMYQRGFEFLPIDLYKSDSYKFQIVDNKLLPPFNSIEGMGAKASQTLYEAAQSRRFLSKDDIKERGHVSDTIINTMTNLGIIDELPQSNQLSFFDAFGA